MVKTPADYRLLAIFRAVADATSFTRAARQLGVGKGTVSRAIAALEAEVGAELLHRTTHRVALSTAGLALYERTARHLVALDAAVGDLAEHKARPTGELRITAPHDFGVLVFAELVPAFLRRYPEVGVDLRLTNQRVDLVTEGYDLAIRIMSGRLADSTLTARRLGSVASGVYAAPAYLARRGEPRSFGDPEHDWVTTALSAETPRAAQAPRPRARVDDFLLLRELLAEGAGIGVLPTYVAASLVLDGRLVHVLPAQRWRGGAVYLLYPSRGQVAPKVTVFRDFLIERLRLRPLDAA